MDGMSEMDNSNMSLIVSTLDEACLANSTEEDNVVYVGAIAVSDTLLWVIKFPGINYFFFQLNMQNGCEVICLKQILEKFDIMFAGSEYCLTIDQIMATVVRNEKL